MAQVTSKVSNEVTGPLLSEPEDVVFAESLESKAGSAELFLPRLPLPSTISASDVSLWEHSPGKRSLQLHVDPLTLCCTSPCGSASDFRAPPPPKVRVTPLPVYMLLGECSKLEPLKGVGNQRLNTTQTPLIWPLHSKQGALGTSINSIERNRLLLQGTM